MLTLALYLEMSTLDPPAPLNNEKILLHWHDVAGEWFLSRDFYTYSTPSASHYYIYTRRSRSLAEAWGLRVSSGRIEVIQKSKRIPQIQINYQTDGSIRKRGQTSLGARSMYMVHSPDSGVGLPLWISKYIRSESHVLIACGNWLLQACSDWW